MATHSSILAWRIPWTEEPGGLWSIGSHRDTPEHPHTEAVRMGLTLLSQTRIGCPLGMVLEAHQELDLGRKMRPSPQRKRKTG